MFISPSAETSLAWAEPCWAPMLHHWDRALGGLGGFVHHQCTCRWCPAFQACDTTLIHPLCDRRYRSWIDERSFDGFGWLKHGSEMFRREIASSGYQNASQILQNRILLRAVESCNIYVNHLEFPKPNRLCVSSPGFWHHHHLIPGFLQFQGHLQGLVPARVQLRLVGVGRGWLRLVELRVDMGGHRVDKSSAPTSLALRLPTAPPPPFRWKSSTSLGTQKRKLVTIAWILVILDDS